VEQATEEQLDEVRNENEWSCCIITIVMAWQESAMGMMDGDVTASTVMLAPWLKGAVQESVKRLMMR
jgi:hypothetical protein